MISIKRYNNQESITNGNDVIESILPILQLKSVIVYFLNVHHFQKVTK